MSHPVGRTLLPYCLERLSDGRYLALNRNYKPVGWQGNDWIDYETSPGAFALKQPLTAADAVDISYCSDDDLERIYLYNDGTEPFSTAENWDAYSARLERFMKLTMV
ncbi:hypothetical protein [Comamonas kerstersii]